jgi:hypothetical protein
MSLLTHATPLIVSAIAVAFLLTWTVEIVRART